MNQERAARCARGVSCAALLLLLAVCGYAGANQTPVQTVSVPVAVQTVSRDALSAASLEETREKLRIDREEALAQLQSVIDHPSSGEEEVRSALAEKTQIASRMETEAALCAVLAHMGFGDAAAIMGEGTVSVIVPWQAAENEQNRVKIIDAAVSQTALTSDCVKIILAKNE